MGRQSKVPLIAPDVEVRPIAGWEGLYAVAEDGRVWSMPRVVVDGRGHTRRIRGRWLKPNLDGKGYSQVGLHRDGVTQLARVHRMVAAVWLPPPALDQDQINHKDRNRTNPAASNLEWCTPSENQLHGWQGRQASPAVRAALARTNRAKRKLTDEQARRIRNRLASGEQHASLAREHRVSETTIRSIGRGRTYSQPNGESHHAP